VLNIARDRRRTISALLSREFAIRVRRAPSSAKGGAGGLLMGVGAVLAFGWQHRRLLLGDERALPVGLGMMLGLGAGAFLAYATSSGGGPTAALVAGGGRIYLHADGRGPRVNRGRAVIVIGLVAAALVLYARSGYGPQGVFCSSAPPSASSSSGLASAWCVPFASRHDRRRRAHAAAALALVVSTLGSRS